MWIEDVGARWVMAVTDLPVTFEEVEATPLTIVVSHVAMELVNRVTSV